MKDSGHLRLRKSAKTDLNLSKVGGGAGGEAVEGRGVVSLGTSRIPSTSTRETKKSGKSGRGGGGVGEARSQGLVSDERAVAGEPGGLAGNE